MDAEWKRYFADWSLAVLLQSDWIVKLFEEIVFFILEQQFPVFTRLMTQIGSDDGWMMKIWIDKFLNKKMER